MGLLDGKVALVTGAGHGIGRGHALELAKQGAKVVVNDLGASLAGEGRGRDADVVVDLIKARGGEAVADYGDVSDEAAAEAMVMRGLEQWGRFDILVNNAGVVRDRTLWNMEVADFDFVMRVHARGTFLTSRAAARHWRGAAKKAGGTIYGRIINTTSGAGLLGHFGQANYSAAKAAVAGMTLTMSVELASIGVTCNLFSPGALTRMTAPGVGRAAREPEEIPEDEFDSMDPSLGSPVVAWLASEESAYISGQCIKVMGDRLSILNGWLERVGISSGGKRWKAESLGNVMSTSLFQTRAPGLRLGG